MSDLVVLRRDALKALSGTMVLSGISLPAQEGPNWKPKVLDPHQLATLEVLEELIIPTTDTPGARSANVHRYVDAFLLAGPAPERERFLAGLGWLDGYCHRKFAKPFVKLTADQQTQVLTTLDRQTEVEVDPGTAFFRQTKSLVSRIYYNTKIGYEELNKGGRVPATYVGCPT
ncbi:MAG: lactose 3-dehydrogenase subunit gamma LacC [Bryobacter sp.]